MRKVEAGEDSSENDIEVKCSKLKKKEKMRKVETGQDSSENDIDRSENEKEVKLSGRHL
jgi:hypothetical protein